MRYNTHTEPKKVPLDFNTVGDNILISGQPDCWIYVHKIMGDSDTDVFLQVKSGSTVVSNFDLSQNQGITIGDSPENEEVPAFQCPPGEDFVINLGSTARFVGEMVYSYKY